MKTKLEMAHDYAMQYLKNSDGKITMHSLCLFAWQYADAMQAEADKRDKEEALQKRKAIREMLNADNTFLEKEGQHFDDVEEWQPDWSQAPSWANWYAYCDKSNYGIWYDFEPHIHNGSWFGNRCLHTGKFEYQGDWRDSLRKRPQ